MSQGWTDEQIGRSMFDVHKFLFMIKPAAFQAGGWPACPA